MDQREPILVIILMLCTQVAAAEQYQPQLTSPQELIDHSCLMKKLGFQLSDHVVSFVRDCPLDDSSDIFISRMDRIPQPTPFHGTAGLSYDAETGEVFIDIEDPDHDSFVGFELTRSFRYFNTEDLRPLVPDVQLFVSKHWNLSQGTIGAKIPNGLYTIGEVLPVGLSEAEFIGGFTKAVFGSGSFDPHDFDLHYSRPDGVPVNSRLLGTNAAFVSATPEPSGVGMIQLAAFVCLTLRRKRVVLA